MHTTHAYLISSSSDETHTYAMKCDLFTALILRLY